MVNMLSVAYALLRFVVGLFFALFSIYFGIKLFDKLTKRIDEWDEIKQGNVAAGIYLSAVILTLSLIVEGGVRSSVISLTGVSGLEVVVLLAFDFLRIIIATILGALAIYVTFMLMDRFTPDIDETEEIKRGNIAVAIIVALIIVSVGFIIRAVVSDISQTFNLLDIVLRIE